MGFFSTASRLSAADALKMKWPSKDRLNSEESFGFGDDTPPPPPPVTGGGGGAKDAARPDL